MVTWPRSWGGIPATWRQTGGARKAIGTFGPSILPLTECVKMFVTALFIMAKK